MSNFLDVLRAAFADTRTPEQKKADARKENIKFAAFVCAVVLAGGGAIYGLLRLGGVLYGQKEPVPAVQNAAPQPK